MRLKSKIIISVVIGSLLTVGYAISSNAQSTQPGSSGDPVVTKSYVDKKIEEIIKIVSNTSNLNVTSGEENKNTANNKLSENEMKEIVSDVLAQIEFSNVNSNNTDAVSSNAYKTVNVPAGKILYGGQGTEVILRSGTAYVSTKGEDGISNVTIGKDLGNGKEVTKNSLLIIPRDDGRGIACFTECWLMVKGSYSIR